MTQVFGGVQPTPPATPPATAPGGAVTPVAPVVPIAPVAPPVAPVVAPAVPAPITLNDPAPPAVPAPNQAQVVEYQPTGDTGLDLALKFVGQLGFDPSRPEIQAAQKGDFTALEASLKALGTAAKGYSAYINVAKESYTRRTTQQETQAAATQQAVVQAAGGVDQWNSLHAWVKENADPSEKAQINAAFAAGGIAATSMVQHLASIYKGAVKAQPAAAKSAVNPNAPKAPAGDGSALSPEQYRQTLSDLRSKYGDSLGNRPEYHQARTRRLAWRA